MFFRYSNQKTARVLPATLPHGDAGSTFGAGKGDIDAQSMTFNDTHTFGSGWLNEFRFGVNQIKFFMTPIDYGTNPAAAVGIPGINLNEATSAMTQLSFQNIRNLGANSNQPLITNQNDLQFFDNVTWLKGRHTLKAGGSVTLRSREILNADTIVGNFGFNNNQTSNCAGQAAELHDQHARPASTWPASCSATRRSKTRNLFDAETYTETRPEYALYLQDDFRVTNKLTINAGLRWDVYVPWIEVDNRQSNFDEVTGRFIVASDNAVVDGIEVGRYLQTYSKRDLAPRLGMAYDVRGDGTHHRPGWLRRLLELLARWHLVVEGPEPAVPAVDGADHDGRCDHLAGPGRPAGASRGRSEPSRRRARRGRSSTSTSATPTPRTGTSTSSRRSAPTTPSRSPTSGRAAAR